MILPPAVFLSDRAWHQMLFRRYALLRQNTDFQPGNVVFRMAFTAYARRKLCRAWQMSFCDAQIKALLKVVNKEKGGWKKFVEETRRKK